MGLRPLHAGMIYGSGPFIPRDAGRRLYTYSGLCPDTQGFGQGWYIYIHTHNTKHIYVCVHTSCLSHARVVPMLDVPTVPKVWDQWPCVCLWRVYIMTVGCCDLWLDDTGLSPDIDRLCRHDRCDLNHDIPIHAWDFILPIHISYLLWYYLHFLLIIYHIMMLYSAHHILLLSASSLAIRGTPHQRLCRWPPGWDVHCPFAGTRVDGVRQDRRDWKVRVRMSRVTGRVRFVDHLEDMTSLCREIHEMLSSFVFSKSIQGSRNQRLNHTRVTRSMPWVRSRYMDEWTRLHGNIGHG